MPEAKQDDETAKEAITPDFLKGIDISPEEEKQMEDAAYDGAAEDIAQREGLSGDDLRAAEENPAQPQKAAADPKEGYKAGFGYRDEGGGKKKTTGKGSFVGRNKKWFIGGGLGAGIAGTILSFTLLLPLKVQHVANNLQSHYFATTEDATGKLNEALLRQYIVKKVVPGMYKKDSCTRTSISKSCAMTSTGDGPIATLYNTWKDNNLEGKLFEKQGIEIRREGNKFYMRQGDMELFSGVYNEKNPKLFENEVYSQMNRSEVRRAMNKAYENETFAKRMLYRYKVGKLLERKYGIKRCVVACETRDERRANKEDRQLARKLKWKYYFIDRVTTPRTQMYALALECAAGGFKCTESTETDNDGRRVSQLEKDVHAKIRAAGLEKPDLEKLQKMADDIGKKGLMGHIASNLVGETFGKVTGKVIPFVGWIDMGARVVDGIKSAGPALKKMNYVVNSSSMVTMYMLYRSNADEIKTGEADAEDIGIVADSLGPNAGTDQNSAAAEQAPIYPEIMGSKPQTVASIFNLLSPKASAFNGYKCNDGTTITSGVCSEVTLYAADKVMTGASLIEDIGNSPELKATGVVADAWLKTGGWILDQISAGAAWLIEKMPGYDQFMKIVEPVATAIARWFGSKAIKDIMGESPSGGRNFEVAAGGADVAGNDFAHYGLGGQRLSDQSVSQIRQEQKQQELDEFNDSSMFARMFDSTSEHSLVSKVALALPSTNQVGIMQSFGSSLLSPFKSISLGSASQAQAASTSDPFGVSQYGYPSDSPVFQTDDLESFWGQNDCSNPDKAKNWGDTSTENPDTGMAENDTPNPCKLLETSVGAGGGYFDSSLLGEDAPEAEDGPLGEAGSVTVATYNALDGEVHAGEKCQSGESNNACMERRSKLQAKIITGQASEEELSPIEKNPAFDIVGMQEVPETQYGFLKEALSSANYDVFPSNASTLKNNGAGKSGKTVIFWNKNKLSQFDQGFAPAMSNVVLNGTGTGGNIKAAWVGLETSSGQKIYVMSIHWPTDTFADPALGDKGTLKEASKLAREWVKSIKQQDPSALVTIMGDFNDHYERANERTTYCELTKGGLLQHTYDMSKGNDPNTPCPTAPTVAGIKDIDHIFVTPNDGVTASGLARMGPRGKYSEGSDSLVYRASDHTPVYVNINLPGSSGGGGTATSDMGDDYGGCSNALGVCGGQCVDFVKFRLLKHGTKYTGGSLGNGYIVAENLGKKYGYTVDNSPAVHSVVSWPIGGVDANGDGDRSDSGEHANTSAGHVAMVGQVNSDGSIVVEEYNIKPGAYGTRTIPANVAKLLTYAHTEVDYK